MAYAEMFVSKDGVITDLTDILGKPEHSFWNYQFVDLNYKFTKAIETKNNTCQVYDIKKWCDYEDGEQVQVWFNDNSGMLTSFVNTNLLTPKTEGLEIILAKAFNGELNKEDAKIYQYK